jgi:hypothetical protein
MTPLNGNDPFSMFCERRRVRLGRRGSDERAECPRRRSVFRQAIGGGARKTAPNQVVRDANLAASPVTATSMGMSVVGGKKLEITQ